MWKLTRLKEIAWPGLRNAIGGFDGVLFKLNAPQSLGTLRNHNTFYDSSFDIAVLRVRGTATSGGGVRTLANTFQRPPRPEITSICLQPVKNTQSPIESVWLQKQTDGEHRG